MSSNTESREASQMPSREVEDRNRLEHTTAVRQVVVSTSSDSAEGLGAVEEVGGSAGVLCTSLNVRYGVQETSSDSAEGLGAVEEIGGSAGVLCTSLDVRYGVQETTTDSCPVRLSSVT